MEVCLKSIFHFCQPSTDALIGPSEGQHMVCVDIIGDIEECKLQLLFILKEDAGDTFSLASYSEPFRN